MPSTDILEHEDLATITEVFDSLKDKIGAINNEAKDFMRKKKTPIYRNYAPLLAKFMPRNFVCGELCKHFPEDKTLIRWALDNEYKDLNKLSEESSSHSQQVSVNDDNNVPEDKHDPEVETDGRIIKLKEKIALLEADVKALREPQLVRIDKKFLTKILEHGHKYLLIKDNYIWESFVDSPSPDVWKKITQEVGF